MNRCGSFSLLSTPHSLFSIWTNLKRSEMIPGAPTRRWGEWIWLTGPSGLHRNSLQGLNIRSIRLFWPDQRSGNPNHPSPQTIDSRLYNFELGLESASVPLIRFQISLIWVSYLECLFFYFRATLGVKEVLQSSKNSTLIFYDFLFYITPTV